ncbi:MAG: hypothetical protein GY799_08535 [Desulfobulbaceae bacterium]|nr:hypothetical protein [Desulfobulbaceae bacterium]
MKLVKITLMSIALFAILLTNAHASNRQVGGLIIGGSTGAIVGNAVGKNVESTIIGATVGGVLGYAIGNELDRHHSSVNKHTDVVAHSKSHYKRSRSYFRDHNRKHNYRQNRHRDYPRYRHHPYSGKCRKVITVKGRHNKTKRVVSTVCGNSYRDHNRNNNRYRYNDRHYR